MKTKLRFSSNLVFLNPNRKTLCCLKKKAFTLIELLVVIAIIALLMAVIVPSLKLAKQKAAAIVCMANVRQLTACWYMYQDENDGKLVNANPHSVNANPKDKDGWIANPFDAAGADCSDAAGVVTDEDELRGIRDGVLYPYINATDVFHCPGDNVRRSKYDSTKIFRSYSIPACLRAKWIRKFSDISSPSSRYCLVEEAEGRNFNSGTWDFYTFDDPDVPSGKPCPYWRDPIGIYHGKNGILGYSDGHAESHKWVDSNTVERVQYYFNHPLIYGYGYGALNDEYINDVESGYDPTQVTDVQFMAQGWAYRF